MSKEDEYVPLATVNDGISFINSILPKSSPASKYLEVCSTRDFLHTLNMCTRLRRAKKIIN